MKLSVLLQPLILLLLPFLTMWLIIRVKAFLAGRKGPGPLQPLRDLVRLLKKGAVYSRTVTPLFRFAPTGGLAAVIMAGALVPLDGQQSVFGFNGDFVLFICLLAAARFLLVAGALETGSSFGGMGASREASFAVFVEPAFFLLAGAMVLGSGQTGFAGMLASFGGQAVLATLAGLVFFIMLLVEGARVPVDDPTTHLELTMIHEAMILDYSGPDLAFIQYAAALKTVIVASLVALVAIPPCGEPLLQLGLTAGGIVVLALAVGVVESCVARVRMSHVPQFVLLMFSMALVALVATLLLAV